MIEYFSTVGGLAVLSVLISSFVIKNLKIEAGWAKQLISWIAPIVLSVIGLVCQLGLFVAFGPVTSVVAWIYTIIAGIGIGLGANGIYDLKHMSEIIDMITKKPIEDEEDEEHWVEEDEEDEEDWKIDKDWLPASDEENWEDRVGEELEDEPNADEPMPKPNFVSPTPNEDANNTEQKD